MSSEILINSINFLIIKSSSHSIIYFFPSNIIDKNIYVLIIGFIISGFLLSKNTYNFFIAYNLMPSSFPSLFIVMNDKQFKLKIIISILSSKNSSGFLCKKSKKSSNF